MMRFCLGLGFALVAVAAAEAGTTKGNGCCYTADGHYCGRAVDGQGHQLPTGSSCDCGIVGAYQPFVGVDVISFGGSDIQSIQVPDIGDPTYELYVWMESGWTLVGVVTPGEWIGFPLGTVERFRIAAIDPLLEIDPSNPIAFPIEVSTNDGSPFSGTRAAWWNGIGDLDGDGAVTLMDLPLFVLAMTNPDGYATAYPNGFVVNADINYDGFVNGTDIQDFVSAMLRA